MSFYHLPHPWNPGYAIPRYVMAEPPERGTFTTQWLPRGTIPGLIPDYFANPMGAKKILGREDANLSGLGSLSGSTLAGSTLRGSTLRGSTLAGSSLGATEYQIEPLGNGNGNGRARFDTYGYNTARGMIKQIRKLPAQHRGTAMRQAMDRIDPTLRSRCEAYATAAQKAGVGAPAALEQGLARALSEGLLTELARLGSSRGLPQPNSLLGLGLDCARSRMQGAAALGIDPALLGAVATMTTTGTPPAKTTPTTGGAPASDNANYIDVGPFKFPVRETESFAVEFRTPAALARLPEAQKALIRKQMIEGDGSTRGGANYARDLSFAVPLRVAGTDPPVFINPLRYAGMCNWIAALGISNCDQVLNSGFIQNATPQQFADRLKVSALEDGSVVPIAHFDHPTTGDAWGIFLLRPAKWPNTPDGKLGQGPINEAFYIMFRRFPSRDWLHKIGHAIQKIAAVIGKASGAIGSAATGVVKFVGAATCAIVGTGGITPPMPGYGAPGYGSPTMPIGGYPPPGSPIKPIGPNPTAAAIGLGINAAKALCAQPPPQMPYYQSDNTLLYLLLGVGLLTVVLATRGGD